MTDTPTPLTDAFYRAHPICELDHAHPDDCEAWLDYTRDLERKLARAREALDQIVWIKDCGIDGVDEQGKLVNFPAAERDAMYEKASEALREISGKPTKQE